MMPAYNSDGYIAEEINSVLSQTCKDIELIICDDASYDYTIKIAKTSADCDSRVKIIWKSENSGVAQTRNRAIKQVTGCYVAFLDFDDVWKP